MCLDEDWVFGAVAVLLAAIGGQQTLAHGQSASLDFLAKPTLIECQPEGADPCFRLQFGFVDETGNPVNLQLPPADHLASRVEVQVDGQTVRPFYAVATAGSSVRTRRPAGHPPAFRYKRQYVDQRPRRPIRASMQRKARRPEFLKNFSRWPGSRNCNRPVLPAAM